MYLLSSFGRYFGRSFVRSFVISLVLYVCSLFRQLVGSLFLSSFS